MKTALLVITLTLNTFNGNPVDTVHKIYEFESMEMCISASQSSNIRLVYSDKREEILDVIIYCVPDTTENRRVLEK